MGKGDRKSKKGKRWRGSYGISRPKLSTVRKRNGLTATPVTAEAEVKEAPKKKAAPKKKEAVAEEAKEAPAAE